MAAGPDLAPARIPLALNALGLLLPLATFATAVGLVYALLAGASIGPTQVGLVVALALILGVLLALTCAVVNWFAGSSIGSWTKNFVPLQQGHGAGSTAPIPLPQPEPDGDDEGDGDEGGDDEGDGDEPEGDAPEASSDGVIGSEVVPNEDKFGRVHAEIAKWEGGYSNDPGDSGGPTKYGITQRALGEWRGRAVSAAEVKALAYDEALQIFRARYWQPLRCDDMPIAVALMTYNAGVNSGIRRGARFLQECLNKRGAALAADGEVGPLTLAAAAKADMHQLVADYAAHYEAFYHSLDGFARFGKGWLNRLKDITATAQAWADEPAPAIVMPSPEPMPADIPGGPPWLARATALLGLYERPGSADNPVIIEMARVCGGKIAATYKHDDIPWCALFVNYCLVGSGQSGNDSLWALDFANYGRRLSGPAVGAIASKKRDGGGHVFLVVGRNNAGRLVGRGGNQSNQVCDDEFDAEAIVAYTWPKDYPLPAKVGTSITDVSALPVVKPVPQDHREVVLPV